MKSRKSEKHSHKRTPSARKGKARTKPKTVIRKGAASKNVPPNPNDPREKALALMKIGVSQTAAAKSVGIGTQRLARYRRATTSSKIKGRKWVIKDRRPAEMYIASGGKIFAVAVSYRTKSAVGRYWNGVNEFLTENDPKFLAPYAGQYIRDISGKKYILETGPNTLRMLDAMLFMGTQRS